MSEVTTENKLDFLKKIEESNEAFNKASKAVKRMIIAQDCIDRIKLDLIKAETGQVIYEYEIEEFAESIGYNEKTCDLKPLINNPSLTCEVCAKGGLFIAYVGRVNKFKLSKLNGGENNSDDVQHKKLRQIFTTRQLALIEYAFEGRQCLAYDEKGDDICFDYDEKTNAYRYKTRYNDKDERLIAICENIIYNKGTFKPI